MSTFDVGTVLRGKYRVERILGKGGMGVVLSAWHLKLDQPVAIKVLLPAMLAHPEIVERFLREGRAASRLQSDHVVRIMDVDTLDDGAPYLVMEQLEGADLSGVRKSKQPLPPHVAADYVLQTAEAIAEAHSLGIIHRDLKPANLFLAQRRDGTTRIKVLDFGISKVASAEGSEEVDLTSAVAVMGSPTYMSPEQMLASRDVDARSDIWALGVILYELTTAQLPFPGKSVPEVCALVMSVPPPPPRSVRAEIPEGLEDVILRCLRKDPAERFQSVGELRAALMPFRVASVAVVEIGAEAVPTLVLPSAVSPAKEVDPATEVLPGAASVSAASAASAGGTSAAVSAPVQVATPARSSRAGVLVAGGVLLLVVAAGVGMMVLGARGTGEGARGTPVVSASAVSPVETGSVGPPGIVVSARPTATASSVPKVLPAVPVAPVITVGKPVATAKATATGQVKAAPAAVPTGVLVPKGGTID